MKRNGVLKLTANQQATLKILQRRWDIDNAQCLETQALLHSYMMEIGMDPAKVYELTEEGKVMEKSVARDA